MSSREWSASSEAHWYGGDERTEARTTVKLRRQNPEAPVTCGEEEKGEGVRLTVGERLGCVRGLRGHRNLEVELDLALMARRRCGSAARNRGRLGKGLVGKMV